jgi:hypothetical protein
MGSLFQSKPTVIKTTKEGFLPPKDIIWFQMTLAVEYETLRPLSILIYPGSPNDTKIFDK